MTETKTKIDYMALAEHHIEEAERYIRLSQEEDMKARAPVRPRLVKETV